ncbi:YdcF family protein [Hydromonas duriensis]|uniref:Uncharacterized SAM-binding protein YcdF (DUF218 family) n=1 Tax=Hydromonas duriensis TaxID=1527608 RepID=A0A4R6YBQ6_9BURK|nr:YdcF family protein [Hydromonas duriensis]TDR33024.1 uncharacterized SAM-binding protein YcdF (DUF218 family) [Hydromonas duriensis]
MKTIFLRLALLFVGLFLALDSIYLMSMHLLNLGIIVPLFLGLLCVFTAWRFNRLVMLMRQRPNVLKWLKWSGVGLLLWIVSLCFFFSRIAHVPHSTDIKTNIHTLIVLGSGTPNCQVSPLLAARLEATAEAAQIWPESQIIVSGGQDTRLYCAEAQVMGDALRRNNIAAERIHQEERSTSTDENLRFSRQLMLDEGLSEPVAIVTSDFHTLRALRIAQKLGYQNVQVISAPTPLYLRYNAWLREYFASISSWLLNEI